MRDDKNHDDLVFRPPLPEDLSREESDPMSQKELVFRSQQMCWRVGIPHAMHLAQERIKASPSDVDEATLEDMKMTPDEAEALKDPDLGLIVDYVGGELSDADSETVRRRIEEDAEFRDKSAGFLTMWSLP